MTEIKDSRIYFISIAEEGYSRSWTYFNGLKKMKENVVFIKLDSKNLIHQFVKLRKTDCKNSTIVVMSPSHYLVLYVRVLLSKKIVLDAGWPLYDGTVVSRKKRGISGIKSYLIDFVSSKLSKKVILESKLQKAFYARKFFVKQNKLQVIYTGLDEESFIKKSEIELPMDIYKNKNIVFFRGSYNSEAGLEVLAQATRILSSEKITFWILCTGLPSHVLFSESVIIDKRFLSKNDIARIQKASKLSLGQMASHERLNRTIPHKAYESAFLRSPYLTGRNPGILEIFSEKKEVFCFNPGDPQDLAVKIYETLENSKEREKVKNAMSVKYNLTLNQKILARQFLVEVQSLK